MPDELSSPDASSRAHMRRALDLAARGWGHTAPNPMVGAVVVRDGAVVGEGWHARYGDAHAEVVALRSAGERARGATMYVSLEPCDHTGKTPPCTRAITDAGIARVVVAVRDPNPEARGGVERLRSAGVHVDVGVEEQAAREVNAPFFRSHEGDLPFTTLKLAMSLDGAIADAQRSSGWLTGALARREVHRLRAGSDAVAVGIGTVLADNPMLTVRDWDAPRVAPRRVIFDSKLRTPLESALVRTATDVPTTIVARDAPNDRARAYEAAGVQLIVAQTAASALRSLACSGVWSLLVEGGAGLAGALLQEGLVDRLVIFQAPIILGEGALNAFTHAPSTSVAGARRLRFIDHRVFGEDVMTSYAFEDR